MIDRDMLLMLQYRFGSLPRLRNINPGSPPASDWSSLISIVSSAK